MNGNTFCLSVERKRLVGARVREGNVSNWIWSSRLWLSHSREEDWSNDDHCLKTITTDWRERIAEHIRDQHLRCLASTLLSSIEFVVIELDRYRLCTRPSGTNWPIGHVCFESRLFFHFSPIYRSFMFRCCLVGLGPLFLSLVPSHQGRSIFWHLVCENVDPNWPILPIPYLFVWRVICSNMCGTLLHRDKHSTRSNQFVARFMSHTHTHKFYVSLLCRVERVTIFRK